MDTYKKVFFITIIGFIFIHTLILNAWKPTAAGHWGLNKIYIECNREPSDATATNIYNYYISGGIGYPQSAKKIYANVIELTLSPSLTEDVEYTVTVSNLRRDSNNNLQNPNPLTLHSFVAHTWQSEAQYILNCAANMNDGAIPETTDNDSHIMPYFSSYAALGLLRAYEKGNQSSQYLTVVTNFLRWYQNHMESTNAWRVSDYDRQSDGSSGNPQTPDSTDSYASLYLWTAWRYFQVTDDTNYLNNNYVWYQRAYIAITNTLQSDDLTWCLPSYHVKYFMDNTEVLQGFIALYHIAKLLGKEAEAKKYYNRAKRMYEALKIYWNDSGNEYYVEKDSDDSLSSDGTFYPDSMAQQMGLIHRLDGDSDRAGVVINDVINTWYSDKDPYTFASSNRIDANCMEWEMFGAQKVKDYHLFYVALAEHDYLYYDRGGYTDDDNALGRICYVSGHYIRNWFFDGDTPAKISLDAESWGSSGSIKLRWVSPGNDGNVGKAYGYIIKYSFDPVETEEDWENASYIANTSEPLPEVAGTTQEIVLNGLRPGFRYYFAIRAYDEYMNYSDISSPVSAFASGSNVVSYKLVDDFETNDNINEFGGNNNVAYAGSAYVSASRVSGYPDWARGGMVGGEKVVYSNCTGGGNYGYLQFDFNGSQNLSSYDYISVWVRKEGTNSIACKIQLVDNSHTIARVLNDYLPGGEILQYWQEAVIPLDAFDTAGGITLNRNSIQRLEFVFDGVWGSEKGTLYFDDIKFVDGNLPVIYVNNNEHRVNDTDPNSLNGKIDEDDNGGSSAIGYSTVDCKHGSSSYRYHISIGNTQYICTLNELSSYSAYPGTPLHYLNLSDMDKLKFWVKGNKNHQRFRVYIQQDTTGSPPGYDDPYTVYDHFNSIWKLVKIPLYKFTLCPKDQVGAIKFAWEGENTTRHCTIYIDDIYFENDFYDMNSPENPINVTASNYGFYIRLKWEAPTNNGDIDFTPLKDLLGYDIYRSTNSRYSNYVKINTDTITELNYNDNYPVAGRTNYYIIVAKDSKCPANVSLGAAPIGKFVEAYPILNITKSIISNKLNNSDAKPIPGSTLYYKIYYTNLGTGKGTNVIIYDRIPFSVIYVSNSSVAPSGWTNQYSTNINPKQTYNSSNYVGTSPSPYKIKWIRWKKEVLQNGEGGNMYYHVIIK